MLDLWLDRYLGALGQIKENKENKMMMKRCLQTVQYTRIWN